MNELCSSAHPLRHSGKHGDLGEAAHAAAVETVEDALGDEKALHGGANITHGLVDDIDLFV